jgi:hypothetical protein
VFNLLARKVSAPWIFEGDIKGCFDSFEHGWIEDHVQMNRKVAGVNYFFRRIASSGIVTGAGRVGTDHCWPAPTRPTISTRQQFG